MAQHRRLAAILEMNASRNLCRGFVPLLTFFVAQTTFADLKVVSQVQSSTNGDYQAAQYAVTYYKGDWVRVDGKNKTVLTNFKTHKTYQIDHLKKTYSVLDEDLATETADMMKEMGAKVSAKVSPTDEHKEIQGLHATKYKTELDLDMNLPSGSPTKHLHLKAHMESWTTTDLGLETLAGSFIGSADNMVQTLLAMNGIGDMKHELSKIKGFTLADKVTCDVDAPEMPAPLALETDYEAVSISQAPLSPALFRVPSDYKKVDDDEEPDIQWRPAGKGS